MGKYLSGKERFSLSSERKTLVVRTCFKCKQLKCVKCDYCHNNVCDMYWPCQGERRDG